MALDTSLYKLIPKAFTIISDAAARMGTIAIKAIDTKGSPKQAYYEDQLITVGALYEQVLQFLILNPEGTAIIGITGQDVSVVNALLVCLKDAAGLNILSTSPNPLIAVESEEDCCDAYDVGQVGSILVSDGVDYVPVSPTDINQVPIWDGTRVIWGNSGGNGIPAGGLANQFLRKTSNLSYAATWQTLVTSMISDLTVNKDELNALDGLDFTNIGADEFNTLAGINTATTIQAQLDLKMSAVLTAGHFFVGNSLNVATDTAPSGDVVFDDLGVFAIQSGVIVDDDISATAGIARTKIAGGSSWRLVINGADGFLSTANAITADRALISDTNGIPVASGVTAEKLSFISTLSGNAQDQLDTKLTVALTPPVLGDMLWFDGTNWTNFAIGGAGTVITSTGSAPVWSSATGNGIPAGGLAQEYLRKATDNNYDVEWHTLVLEDITDLTVTAAELNLLSGLTVGAAEINWLEDLDGNVQDQLNSKMTNALGYHNMWVGGPGDTAQQLAPGPDGSVLKIIGTSPQWALPPIPGNVTGPVSSTDNAVVRFNGTGGDAIQNSLAILDDAGHLYGLASLTINHQGELFFGDADDSNFVAIRASAVMTADYMITLPDAPPTAGTALTFDGTNYVWSIASGGGAVAFTDLTDVPSAYVAGDEGKMVVVRGDLGGLEFVTATSGISSVNGTPNRITVTPGFAPVVDIASNYAGQASIITLGTVTTGAWQATPVGLTYGGTGAALTAPAGDRIFFWDQSATSTAWLDLGTGLTITGTTITATGSYNNEMAQDAVGNILTDSATIALVYVDEPTPTITANVKNNSITGSLFRQSAALSVVGNPSNALANVVDIAAAVDNQVLRRFGTTLGFGAVNLSSPDAVVGTLSIANGGTGTNAFTFLALTDTPDTYAGNAGKFVVVNTLSNGLDFVPYVVPPYFLAKEVPAGAIDGINTVFTLSFTPSPGSESVYINGVLQASGADYTISGATITLVTPLEITPNPDKIVVVFGGSTGWAGISDGNKGDITVSGTGSSWVINNDAVTFAKMQNINQFSMLGRVSSGVGDIEQLSGAQVTALLNTFTYTLNGLVPAPTGSGSTRFLREDQTWQVPASGGGSGLPPDGNYGDIAVSSTGTNWTIRPDAVSYSKIQNATALSVLGNGGGVAGDLADIVASADELVLRRAGSTVGFGQITSGGIANSAITYSKMQNGAGTSVLGRAPSATGAMSSIVATADDQVLVRLAGTLTFATLANASISNGAITYNKIQDVSGPNLILGRASSGAGPMEELTPTQVALMIPVFTNTINGVVPAPGTPTGKFLRDDHTWQVPAGGGGGISNTANISELMKWDGTTAAPSGLFSTALGNMSLGGSATTGSARNISANGSAANIDIQISPKGTLGSISLQAGASAAISMSASTLSASFNSVSLTAGNYQLGVAGTASTITIGTGGSNGSLTHVIKGGNGFPSPSLNIHGQSISIVGGDGNAAEIGSVGGNANLIGGASSSPTGFGGSVNITSGVGPTGAGTIIINANGSTINAKANTFTFANITTSRTVVVSTTSATNNTISTTGANLAVLGGPNLLLNHGTGASDAVIIGNQTSTARQIAFNTTKTSPNENTITSIGSALTIGSGSATLKLSSSGIIQTVGIGGVEVTTAGIFAVEIGSTMTIGSSGTRFTFSAAFNTLIFAAAPTVQTGLPSGALWRDPTDFNRVKMVP